jgi:hypothetical protein
LKISSFFCIDIFIKLDKILNICNPSIAQVKTWAYDEDMYFMEQDEELLLHAHRYMPTMLELALDNKCPKQNACYTVLESYSFSQLEYRNKESIQKIIALEKVGSKETFTNKKVNEWKINFKKIVDLYFNPRPLTNDECAFIIKTFLTAGRVYQTYKELQTTTSGYKCYHGKYNAFNKYGYIHPQKCIWVTSHKQGEAMEDVLQKLSKK